MGLAYADIDLENPREPQLGRIRVRALADSGAMMLCLPQRIVDRLRLEKAEERPVNLADGTRVMVAYVGPVRVRFQTRECFVGAYVTGDEVLLGAVPMEDLDLVISPRTRTVTVSDPPSHRL